MANPKVTIDVEAQTEAANHKLAAVSHSLNNMGGGSGAHPVGANIGHMFTHGLEMAHHGLNELAMEVTGVLGVIGVSFAAFKGAEAFAEGLKHAFEGGKEFTKLSTITGQSISDLYMLKRAFMEAGASPDSLQMGLSMLQKSLGGTNEMGEPTDEMFRKIGLHANDLKGQSSVEQLKAIGAAVNNLGSQEEKMAVMRKIFSRNGAEMLAVLGDPKVFEEAAAKTRVNGKLMEENAAMFKKVANSMEGVGLKIQGFFLGLASQLGPIILPIIDAMDGLNLSGIGVGLGEGISSAIQLLTGAFKSGLIGDMFGLSMEIGAKKGMNYLLGALVTLGNVIIQTLCGAVAVLASPDYWKGMLMVFMSIPEILLGAATILGGALLAAIESPVASLMAGFTWCWENMKAGMQTAGIIIKNLLIEAALAMLRSLEGIADKLGFGKMLRDAEQKLNSTGSDTPTTPRTYAEILAEKRSEGLKGMTGGVVDPKAAVDTGWGMVKDGFSRGTSGVGKVLTTEGDMIGKPVMDALKGFKPVDAFATSDEQSKLDGMYAKAMKAGWKADKHGEEEHKKGKGSGEVETTGVDKGVVADSLQSIGGGGGVGGGGVLDTATEQLSETRQQTTHLAATTASVQESAGSQKTIIDVLSASKLLLEQIAANTRGGGGGGGGLTLTHT